MLATLPLLLLSSFASAHTVISYPGWRGNNLMHNGTLANDHIKPGSLGINYDENTGSYTYPYGMQWMYPCGGMPTSQNRTKWPVNGGAIAIQPGWASGHQTALFYINMGLGTEPLNMSHPIVPVFQIVGPSNDEYPGTFCFPQVPLPANLSMQVGQHATLQVVEVAVHGAALYNCVDIEFADPADPDITKVTPDNCFNSTKPNSDIGFNLVFSTVSLSGAPSALAAPSSLLTALAPALIALATVYWS